MSLNLDYTKCENPDSFLTGDMHPWLFHMAALMMATGVDEITKKNVFEIWMRGCIITRLSTIGHDVLAQHTPVDIIPDAIRHYMYIAISIFQ